MYVEKDQECWTIPANSKSEESVRRASTSLWENKRESIKKPNKNPQIVTLSAIQTLTHHPVFKI